VLVVDGVCISQSVDPSATSTSLGAQKETIVNPPSESKKVWAGLAERHLVVAGLALAVFE
jgi:hypothetical protein